MFVVKDYQHSHYQEILKILDSRIAKWYWLSAKCHKYHVNPGKLTLILLALYSNTLLVVLKLLSDTHYVHMVSPLMLYSIKLIFHIHKIHQNETIRF